MSMPETAITNSKRLVRGLFWERVRWLLRAHYCSHHQRFRLLTLAGPLPGEEVRCIRSVMPNAHITAVDKDRACVLAAMGAGVDEAHHLDLGDYEKEVYQKATLPEPLMREGLFDAISLDMTGVITPTMKELVGVYWSSALMPRGCLLVTFSYGRDVTEAFDDRWERDRKLKSEEQKRLRNMPPHIQKRIWYLLLGKVQHIECVMQYRSNAMPMIALLMAKGRSVPLWQNPQPIRYRAVDGIDYDLALASENIDLASVFACPIEVVDQIRGQKARQKAIARKAVETRKLRQLKAPPKLRLITGPGPEQVPEEIIEDEEIVENEEERQLASRHLSVHVAPGEYRMRCVYVGEESAGKVVFKFVGVEGEAEGRMFYLPCRAEVGSAQVRDDVIGMEVLGLVIDREWEERIVSKLVDIKRAEDAA